jgi:hypothetical protein
MNDEILIDVIVQTILFLELSDETIIDDDAAVEMMEQMAFTLQKLKPDSRTQFVRYLRDCIQKSGNVTEREVLESFAEHLTSE